jgi:hypothetical protein
VCVSCASTVLCGGRSVMIVPTATSRREAPRWFVAMPTPAVQADSNAGDVSGDRTFERQAKGLLHKIVFIKMYTTPVTDFISLPRRQRPTEESSRRTSDPRLS